jgi:hypothetical protein
MPIKKKRKEEEKAKAIKEMKQSLVLRCEVTQSRRSKKK